MDSGISPVTSPCFLSHTFALTSPSLQTRPMPKAWQQRTGLGCHNQLLFKAATGCRSNCLLYLSCALCLDILSGPSGDL